VRPVNLLPPRYRPARASGERPGIGYAALGVLAVLFLMVLAYVITQNQINDAKDATAKAQAEQQAAQARVGALSAFGDFASLAQQREQAVVSIASVRFDWERLMREMALVLPKDVYLTSFAGGTGGGAEAAAGGATATGPTITLAGCAPTHKAVATTVVRLRSIHNVTDVNLQSSQQAAAAGSSSTSGAVCRTSWTGTLAMNAETAPTAPARVPARLGGGQ